MGITSSALPELSVVAIRATGPVFATASFINGRYGYAFMLFAIVHFIILLALGNPALANDDAWFSVLVTYPLIALAAAVVGMFNFYLMRLAELLPMTRKFGRFCGRNFGPTPTMAFLVVHFLVWALVTIGAEVAFEWFFASDVVLGLVINLVLIVVGYAAMLLLDLFFFNDQVAVWGNDKSAVMRTVLTTGVYHLVLSGITGLVVVFQADHNWAWVAAAVLLGVMTLVTVLVWFFYARRLKRPPRTGDMTTFASHAAAEIPDAEDNVMMSTEDGEDVAGYSKYDARAYPSTYSTVTARPSVFGTGFTGSPLHQMKH